MKVLVTGSKGFIGRNLEVRLKEQNIDVLCLDRFGTTNSIVTLLDGVDCVFHLAGVNRPFVASEYETGNVELTRQLCDAVKLRVRRDRKRIRVVFSSSIQADTNSPYGMSKKAAEDYLFDAGSDPLINVFVFRLANVFGKWGRPNYNSVVATFCHNLARDLPIEIHDPDSKLQLVFIDDVINRFLSILNTDHTPSNSCRFLDCGPVYEMTVGDLADRLEEFKASRQTLDVGEVAVGLQRALYATYVSYLPIERVSYEVPSYRDSRGKFIEMIKTPRSGQVSIFTASPGVTRGGHYHHTKTEKFLVIRGAAIFRFRNLATDEVVELEISADDNKIVETLPGWAHDITNIGQDDLIVTLWANEVFDKTRADTYQVSLADQEGLI